MRHRLRKAVSMRSFFVFLVLLSTFTVPAHAGSEAVTQLATIDALDLERDRAKALERVEKGEHAGEGSRVPDPGRPRRGVSPEAGGRQPPSFARRFSR